MAEKITIQDGKLQVPNHVVIPFIEGDGIGKDITAPTQKLVDAAILAAYGMKRSIKWKEVLAGEKAFNKTGEWLPQETLDAFAEYIVGIKGPLTTPIGGGIRSLNVARNPFVKRSTSSNTRFVRVPSSYSLVQRCPFTSTLSRVGRYAHLP